MTRLEIIEVEERALAAKKYAALAEMITIATAEAAHTAAGKTAGGTTSDGTDGTDSTDTDDAAGLVTTGDRHELAMRTVRAELSAALHLSETTVDRRLDVAYRLCHRFPRMHAEFATGRVSEQHVQVMLDAATPLSPADTPQAVTARAGYEAAVLEVAVTVTPNRLRPIAKRLAAQFGDVSVDERHRVAREKRRVWLVERDCGMADLVAHLPAVEAVGIYNRLMRMSKAVSEAEARTRSGDSTRRSRDEIRADVLADILIQADPNRLADTGTGFDTGTGGSGAGLARVHAHVQVVVPVELLQHDGADSSTAVAPVLAGYGPIDSVSARQLAAASPVWDVARIDRASGMVVSVDRYRPSEAMRRVLRVRDQHCRFPGCRAPVARCDIDHTIDAQHGGPTTLQNLAHLCRGHHTLKHHGGWRVHQEDQGVLVWKSPTGRTHQDRPPSTVAFPRIPTGQQEPPQQAPQRVPLHTPQHPPEPNPSLQHRTELKPQHPTELSSQPF